MRVMTVSDSELAVSLSVDVTLKAVNSAPTVTVAAGKDEASVEEDAELVLVEAFALADEDVGAEGLVTVSVGVEHGRVWLAGDALDRLSFSEGTGEGDAACTFEALLDDAKAAFRTVSYRPDADWNGADALAVTLDDRGNSGEGGALTATASVAITVSAINDRPTAVVAAGSTMNLRETGGRSYLAARRSRAVHAAAGPPRR